MRGAEGYVGDHVHVLRVGEPDKKVAGHKKADGLVGLPYVKGKLTHTWQVTWRPKAHPDRHVWEINSPPRWSAATRRRCRTKGPWERVRPLLQTTCASG